MEELEEKDKKIEEFKNQREKMINHNYSQGENLIIYVNENVPNDKITIASHFLKNIRTNENTKFYFYQKSVNLFQKSLSVFFRTYSEFFVKSCCQMRIA